MIWKTVKGQFTMFNPYDWSAQSEYYSSIYTCYRNDVIGMTSCYWNDVIVIRGCDSQFWGTDIHGHSSSHEGHHDSSTSSRYGRRCQSSRRWGRRAPDLVQSATSVFEYIQDLHAIQHIHYYIWLRSGIETVNEPDCVAETRGTFATVAAFVVFTNGIIKTFGHIHCTFIQILARSCSPVNTTRLD